MVLLAVCSTLVLYLLVCSSIAFTGRDAWICSGALGGAVAMVWAGIARLRSQPAAGLSRQADDIGIESIDALRLFGAPVAGVRSRAAAVGVLIALPFIAYTLVELVRQFDWNFLLQKLGVLIVWLVAFATAHAIARAPDGWLSPALLRAIPVGVLVLYHLASWTSAHAPIDRYVAVDPSFRLLRDARTAHSSETVDYYRYLRANTLLAPRQVQAADIDFTPSLRPASGSLPHIFLIIVDSMRRDYLSPYNPRVTFTPRIGELAAGAYVFERAFSRYSGTALAIPSIWAGGMVPHMLDQPDFLRRNTLLKLLDANDYLLLMGIDHIVEGLVPVDGNFIRLDEGKGTMDVDVCGTVDELARTVQNNRGRPMFFYSLPQNVHIAVATKRTVPENESYPAGFYDRIASSVHRVDACLGRFIDFLRREDLTTTASSS